MIRGRMGSGNSYRCGTEFEKPNEITLEVEEFTLYCRDWRNCEYCLRERINRIMGAIIDALNKHDALYIISLNSADAKEFVRKTDSSNYMRFPSQGRVHFIYTFTDFDRQSGDELGREDLNEGFLKKLAFVKKGRRTSGNLMDIGRERDKDKDGISIRKPIFSVHPHDRKAAKECWAKVAARTAHWGVDANNIHLVVNERSRMYKQELQSAGIHIQAEMTIGTIVDPEQLGVADLTPIKRNDPELYNNIVSNRRYVENVSETVWDEIFGGIIGLSSAPKGIPKPT